MSACAIRMNLRWIAIPSSVGFLSGCVGFGMWGGSGTVLDSNTLAPVAGATVTLECMRSGLIHGATKVKDLSTNTDDRGRFSFSIFEVFLDCDHAHVHPHKEGFFSTKEVDPRYDYSYPHYDKIPERLYLTPLSERTLQRLKYEAVFMPKEAPSDARAYSRLYGGFIWSRDTAKTDLEKTFVRERYCAFLIAAYRQLSNDERSELKNLRAGRPGGFSSVPIDHDLHVAPFCTNE